MARRTLRSSNAASAAGPLARAVLDRVPRELTMLSRASRLPEAVAACGAVLPACCRSSRASCERPAGYSTLSHVSTMRSTSSDPVGLARAS